MILIDKIKEIYTWVKTIDERLWKDQVTTSSVISKVSIIVTAVASAIYMILEGGIEESWMFPLVFIFSAFNVIESILIAKTSKVAAKRSLLMIGLLIAASIAGIALIIGICIIICLAIIGFILYLFSPSGGSSNSRKTKIDGQEVRESRDLLGGGRTYESISSDRKWRSDDGGNTASEL